nr:MAG TPA: hypothetical protein [Caudoviricetes sp.]
MDSAQNAIKVYLRGYKHNMTTCFSLYIGLELHLHTSFESGYMR